LAASWRESSGKPVSSKLAAFRCWQQKGANFLRVFLTKTFSPKPHFKFVCLFPQESNVEKLFHKHIETRIDEKNVGEAHTHRHSIKFVILCFVAFFSPNKQRWKIVKEGKSIVLQDD